MWLAGGFGRPVRRSVHLSWSLAQHTLGAASRARKARTKVAEDVAVKAAGSGGNKRNARGAALLIERDQRRVAPACCDNDAEALEHVNREWTWRQGDLFSAQSAQEQRWPRRAPESASIAELTVSCASRRTLAWPRGLPKSSSASKNWGGGGRQVQGRETPRGCQARLRGKI